MNKLLTISFLTLTFSAHAEIAKEKLNQCALELVQAQVSGVHMDGKGSCLEKNKFQHTQIKADVFEGLELSKLKYINFKSVKLKNVKRIHKKFERYQATFTVKSEDGNETYEDSINFSVNNKKNQQKYGLVNLLKSTDQVLLRSDCK